ncbi:hypothetical protein FQN54_002095 [Arachnomyces sp. PD_36]|nr:hypothetical protein FQN54_002095 [Arachnomyces sp. PD_36]
MAAPPATALVMSNMGIFSCLTAIKPESAESPVSILWTNICATFFTTNAGFKIADKEPVGQDEMIPDAIVFQIRMRNPAAGQPQQSWQVQEKQIFIVECKRPSKDTPAEWDSALDQLAQYCEANVNGSQRILGATAIGTKVKFWRYDAPNMIPLVNGTFDLNEAAGRNEVEAQLIYVRNNGWNWTASG